MIGSKPQQAVVVDRNGVEIKPGQTVLVYNDERTREAIVVTPFPDRPTKNAPGFWVDVNIDNRGPEGMPSYLLDVIGDVVGVSANCPFREYLRSEHSEGKTEFRIVLKGDDSFYIHPLGKDGVSGDFLLTDAGIRSTAFPTIDPSPVAPAGDAGSDGAGPQPDGTVSS